MPMAPTNNILTPPPISPLELPELIVHIARYLDRSELTKCVRVCRLWHRSLLLFIWRDIRIIADSSSARYPSLALLLKNAPFIKRLTIYGFILRTHTQIHLPALETLRLTLHQKAGRPNIPGAGEISRETIMIRHHPSITNLILSSLSIHDNMDFWKAVRDSRSLDSLHFSYAIVGLELADIFWQTCTRLEFLCIAFAEVPDIPSFATHSFSRIQHLVLSWVRGGLSPERQLELMVQCPQLQRLTWRGMHDQLPLNALCDKAAQGVWPKLEELNLEDTQIRDEDLSVLLTSINRLTVLQANSTGFALLSFEALSKHFSTLVYLDIENCPKASSPMVHAIMVSCPSLIKMRAPMICGTDVIQGDGKSELGQPWVCAKLKELSLCLDLGGLDSQMDILQRLGDLKQLENLNISTRKQLSGEYSGRSLQFSLEKGIDSLRTLRRLSVFEFDGVDQDMGESEILWVMEHWKNLQIIRGRLNRDLMRHYELMAILKTRQIDLED